MVASFIEKNVVPIILSLVSILLAWNWNRQVERKIEGQREERVRRAHEDITALIIRNAVHNEIPIREMNLNCIINSTLRKYQIINELFFPKQEILEDIYTGILDNEYILVNTKNELKKEIEDIIKTLETPIEEEAAETKETILEGERFFEKVKFISRTTILVIAVGVLVIFSFYLYGYAFSLEPPYLLLYIVSIVSIQIMIAREIFRHYAGNSREGGGKIMSEREGGKQLPIGPR